MPAVEHIPNAPDPPARATTQATEHKKAGLGQTVNARFEPACTPARAPGGRQQLTLRQHVDTPHRRTRKPPPRAAEARREIRRHDVAPRTQRRTATRAPAARAKPARPVTNATRTDVHGRQTGTERENQARAPRAALATRSPASPEDAIRRPPAGTSGSQPQTIPGWRSADRHPTTGRCRLPKKSVRDTRCPARKRRREHEPDIACSDDAAVKPAPPPRNQAAVPAALPRTDKPGCNIHGTHTPQQNARRNGGVP